jgi:hypothetical protein
LSQGSWLQLVVRGWSQQDGLAEQMFWMHELVLSQVASSPAPVWHLLCVQTELVIGCWQ